MMGKKDNFKKKKPKLQKLSIWRITLPTTEQRNSLIGQNPIDYIIMRQLIGLINLQEKFKLELPKTEITFGFLGQHA